MPALANVVLTDRATTPANHTFTPNGRDGDGARYAKAGSSPIGDYLLTIVPRKTASGRRKVDIALTVPVLVTETVNGVTVPTLARANRAKISLDMSADSTLQERKDLMGFVESLAKAATAQVNGVIVDGEMLW